MTCAPKVGLPVLNSMRPTAQGFPSKACAHFHRQRNENRRGCARPALRVQNNTLSLYQSDPCHGSGKGAMRQGKSGPGLNSACPNPSSWWQISYPKATRHAGPRCGGSLANSPGVPNPGMPPLTAFSTTPATASVSSEVHLASQRSYPISPGLGLPGRSAPPRLLV